MKPVTLSDLSKMEKIQLLKALGYDYDGEQVTRGGAPYQDPYSGYLVPLDAMAIMPGSAIVIHNNPVSIAGYVADYLAAE